VFEMNISTKSGNSSPVVSRQETIHPRLDGLLRKHFETPWLQPMRPPSVAAFNAVTDFAGSDLKERELILDSGCGSGESTRTIASQNPGSLVLGIDRSIHRLKKTGHGQFPCREGNIIWIRAELETFWRLALDQGWKPARHYLLYPNPWPKRSQLQRRWHGHPVFPAMLGLGGDLELRCNWSVYAAEFAHAIEYVSGVEIAVEQMRAQSPLSLFERKYAASGHPLFKVKVASEVLSKPLVLLR